jgi:hypothetical protein
LNPQSLEIDLEWACNFEQAHSRFDSYSILVVTGPVRVLSEFALKLPRSSAQLVDTTNVQPSVKARRGADQGNQHSEEWNDEEQSAGSSAASLGGI